MAEICCFEISNYEYINFEKRRRFRCCFSSLSSDQSVFIQHCRKIAEQLQRSKPVWDQKVDLEKNESIVCFLFFFFEIDY